MSRSVFIIILFTLYSCTSYKISRLGYQNLRETIDTTCIVEILEGTSTSTEANKLGSVVLKPRPFQKKNTSKHNALSILKQEACAINANKIYIIDSEEKKSGAYSCKAVLYREVRKTKTIPDFIKRSKEEWETAKRQRKEMEQALEKKPDTVTVQKKSIDTSAMQLTVLKEYDIKKRDSVPEKEEAPIAATQKLQKEINIPHPQQQDSIPEKKKIKGGLFATVGHQYGGKTLAGAELEIALHRFGIFGGVGAFGSIAGMHFHIKPDPISSYVSIFYGQNSDFDNENTYTFTGAGFNYRGRRWLSLQLGLGKVLDSGAAKAPGFGDSGIIPVYSIGAYVPF